MQSRLRFPFAAAVGLLSLSWIPSFGQSCAQKTTRASHLEFVSEFKPMELTGFFPYVPDGGSPDTSSPPIKYASESWAGGGTAINPACGCFTAYDDIQWSGSWTFSTADFSSSSNKSVTASGNGCGGAFPVNATNLTIGLTDGPALACPGAVTNSTTSRRANIPGPATYSSCINGYIYSGTDVTESLDGGVSIEAAKARAETNKTVGAASQQFWDAFSPANQAAIWNTQSGGYLFGWSRTSPVTFHQQTVKFRALVDQGQGAACSVASKKYQAVYYYYKWPAGSPKPTIPNFAEGGDEVEFKDPPYYVPQSGYHQYPDPVQGENIELAYVELTKQCDAGVAGTADPQLGSVKVAFSLGSRVNRQAAGYLSLYAGQVTSDLYSTKALLPIVPASPDVIVVRDSAHNVRQVNAPETLADVVTIDANSYEIRFYYPNQVGAQGAGSIYAVSGTPYATFRLENPDAGTASNRLKLTETRDAQSKETIFSGDGSTITMITGNGLRQETLVDSINGPDRTRIRTVKDNANQTTLVGKEVWHTYPWGEVMTQMVYDPDGAALTTNYSYYTDSSDTQNYGLLKQTTEAFGHWKTYSYDSQRLVKTVEQFLDSTPGSSDSSNRVTSVSYGTIADSDGDGIPEQLVTTVQSLLGQEVGRSYQVIFSQLGSVGGQSVETRWDIVATVSGAAWNAATNLVTKRTAITGGDLDFRPVSELRPDGTLTTYSYTSTAANLTTESLTGQANSSGTAVVAGTRTVLVETTVGREISRDTYDYPSGLHLESENVTQVDPFGRPMRLDYLDGTYELRTYACCGPDMVTDRLGVVTNYNYNDLGYVNRTTRAGIAQSKILNPNGQLLSSTRIGTDNSQITTESHQYDLSGRLVLSKDALNQSTSINVVIDGNGHKVETTTQPDSGTIVRTYAKDGSLLSVGGTASRQQLSYSYGVDGSGVFTKEIRLGTNGTTTEYVTNYVDLAGRNYKRVYADNATEQSYFNNLGQLVKQVDADGVATLYGYNGKGEQEQTAIDLDGNGQMDLNGTDRVTRVHQDVTTDHGATVLRATTTVWTTDNDGTTTQDVSVQETIPGGLHSWSTSYGLTTETQTIIGSSGARTVTITAPDTTVATNVYQADLLTSTTLASTTLGQLSATTYAYDPHGRLQSTTDARNGATSYTYYDDDQVKTVTTPDPDPSRTGNGYDPQQTAYAYDNAGRLNQVTQPDNGVVSTVYYPTGLVQQVSGARTYPVKYTYDTQGRMKTMSTWQNFSGNSGLATTTWNYDSQRGWLVNKRYNDNKGPSYTYFSSGRLHTRSWARSLATTTYGYNAAGDLSGITYSDSTSPVSLTYDRVGRPHQISDGGGTRTLGYHLSGQLQDETYSSGILNGISINRSFDDLNRFSGISATSVPSVTYHYDDASRLQTVTSGTNAVNYSYLSNSALVQGATFSRGGGTRLTTTKNYDYLDRLTAIANTPSASTAVNAAYLYNSANQRTRMTREDNSYWSYGYDALGQVNSAGKYKADATAINGLSYGYVFDDIGNRKNATVNGQASVYSPNLLNEYSQRTVPATVDVLGTANAAAAVLVNQQPATRQDDLFYQSLSVNNSTSAVWQPVEIFGARNGAGANGETIATTANRHAFVPKTPELYGYDDDGNLTSDGRWSYTWDAENRLISMQTSSAVATAFPSLNQRLEFAYDAQGRRISKKVSNWNGGAWALASSTLFAYDGWNMLADLNALSGNAAICTYAWGLDLSGSLQGAGGVGGLLLTSTTVSGQSTDLAADYDGNGNVTALVDLSTGVQSATYEYGPFGTVIKADGVASAACRFGFSTKYQDSETGLLYYGLRYYSPSHGRWLSRDPIEERGGVNLYGMVGNSPVNWADPFGLCKIEVRYSKLGTLLGKTWYHAYVVTTEPDGTQTYYRGGPSGDGPSSGATGKIGSGVSGNISQSVGSHGSRSSGLSNSSGSSNSTGSSNSSSPGASPGGATGFYGPWGPITTESGRYVPGTIDYDSGTPPSVTVLDNNESCACYAQKLKEALNKIDDAKVAYNPFGDNSNATAYQIIQDAGFPRPNTPTNVWVPGSDHILP